MFDDFRVFIDDKRVDFKYDIINNNILCSLNYNKNSKLFYTFIDENIYEVEFDENISFNKESKSKYSIDLGKVMSEEIKFNIILNFKYLMKAYFDYINKRINITELIDRLNLFKSVKDGNKYVKEIDELINEIDNKSINELLLDNEDEYERVYNLLVNNSLIKSFSNKMSDKDLMLLVTWYISSRIVPKVNQETFDNMVKEAINYEASFENVWRLAMSYDDRGYKYDIIDNYFVNQKNIRFLNEYISSIWQVNKDKIVKMIIDTNDKEYIKNIVNNGDIFNYIDEDLKKILINEVE